MVKYTLHYFNGRGRAEISRLIFAAAGVEYKDDRIEDWPKTKSSTPLGQVPYLDIDDQTQLPQSLSIARYLAREYNLVGSSNLDAAKADAVVDTCIDVMTAFYNKVFLVSDHAAKELALKKFLAEDAQRGLENIEKLVNQYGQNGHAVILLEPLYTETPGVGNQLTWADLFIYEITFCLLNYQNTSLDSFHVLKAVRSSVEKNENVANYLKNRPVTPF